MRYRVIHFMPLAVVLAVLLTIDRFARAQLQLAVAALPAVFLSRAASKCLPRKQRLMFLGAAGVVVCCFIAFPILAFREPWFPGDSWSLMFHPRSIPQNTSSAIWSPLLTIILLSLTWGWLGWQYEEHSQKMNWYTDKFRRYSKNGEQPNSVEEEGLMAPTNKSPDQDF